MLTVRQCMIGETAWFRKQEGEYHYMGESHGAGDVVRPGPNAGPQPLIRCKC